ncbi:MAG: hypothetical protein COV44_02505 [Deltaproteobacteria bacterium CG11_big_fil_rev_8_21_14_0_20_45_16]|nr:MAG: hypothetical protein COV44_02505 [Deltaproteobacteria bacterium CG11_big_fil_rev_8_21_14_0_20_45_16]
MEILQSASKGHASLFFKVIESDEFRLRLLERTTKIRENQIKEDLTKRLLRFIKTSVGSQESAIIGGLFFMTIRYLEDIGILPIHSREYSNFALSSDAAFEAVDIESVITKFSSNFWFRKSEGSVFTAQEIETVKAFCVPKKNRAALKKLLFNSDGEPFDLSDIYIDHLGSVYEVAISKHSEGAHYTPHSVGRKLAQYLASMNHATRNKFNEDSNKVIVDIACGSVQLLRTLIPFAHYFLSLEQSDVGKNCLRRRLIHRMAGVDKDPNSAFICKVGLGLIGAEAGRGLAVPRLVKCEDTLDAFIDSRRNFFEIPREDIFAIVTNPPWESLEFNESNLYRRITGKSLPKKASLNSKDQNKINEHRKKIRDYASWAKKNSNLIEREKKRIDELKIKCDQVAAEHPHFFTGKKNLALYFMFVLNRLLVTQGPGPMQVVWEKNARETWRPRKQKRMFEDDSLIALWLEENLRIF